MVATLSFLNNAQLIVGALGTLAFLAAAWTSAITWTVHRESKYGLRILGFSLLSAWTILSLLNLGPAWTNIIQTIALLLGLATITVSCIIDLPSQSHQRLPAPLSKKDILARVQAIASPVSAQREKLTSLVAPPPRREPRQTSTVIFISSLVLLVAALSVAAFWLTIKFSPSPEQTAPARLPEAPPTPTPTTQISPGPTPGQDETEQSATPEHKATVTIQDTETGTLNVRDGASTGTPVIATVSPGVTYELLEQNEANTWYKIQVDEDTAGWISATYATVATPD